MLNLLEITQADDLQAGLQELADLPTTTEEASQYFTKLLTMLEEFAVTYGGKLIIAIILLIVGFKIVNTCTKKIKKSKAMQKIDSSTSGFICNILGIVFKIIIGITALAIMGVPMTSIVAVVGSCGLAIGLALQGSLANIAGGFIILILHPFSTGDFVVTGDVSGTVEEIGVFYTKILTVDNRRVVIPNSNISNATLTNVSALKTRRVDLTFNASYNDDITKVENILVDVCRKNSLVIDEPAPFARLSAHKDSALEYTVRAWCKTDDYWTVYFDLIKEAKLAFDENGISVPYPQMDVHTK